jgi:glutamate 5-kinase
MAKDESRLALQSARRIVVKAGTRVLVQANGRPDQQRLRALVKDLVALKRSGREVILVSSGAVGAGMEALGLKSRPTRLPDLQMAAAVGQTRLMTKYQSLFEKERTRIGQILLTHDDLKHRTRHLNARNTILNLLRNDIVPVVNENDVIATEEVRFGDNDQLAALVATLVDADLLVLLTSTDGLRAPTASGRTSRVSHLPAVTKAALALARGKGSQMSTGGMASKLESAQTAVDMGTPVVIANGRKTGILSDILDGKNTGTLIGLPAGESRKARSRKQWIAFFHRAAGTVVVDEGAVQAIVTRGKSLLPIGVSDVIGDFPAGSMVNIRGLDESLIARGLADYSSGDIRRIQGRRSSALKAILGQVDYDEVIHRDNMTILKDRD